MASLTEQLAAQRAAANAAKANPVQPKSAQQKSDTFISGVSGTPLADWLRQNPSYSPLVKEYNDLLTTKARGNKTGGRMTEAAAKSANMQYASLGGDARVKELASTLAPLPGFSQAYIASGVKTPGLGSGADLLAMFAAFAAAPYLAGSVGTGAAGTASLPSGGMAATGSVLPASGISGTGMTEGLISGALNPATAGNIGLASGLGTTAAGITEGTIASSIGSLAPAAATLSASGISQEVLKNAVQQSASSPGLLSSISQATGLSPSTLTSLASQGISAVGGLLSGQAATSAAQQSADAQIRAAQIAADAAKFRPVGVATRFGQSQFGYDAAGNLTSAGYQLSPELKAQQDTLMGMSNQALAQYQGAQAATAPLGQGAQTLFGLGQGYLATTPQEQAAKYMAEQQALLAPTREREMAALQARLQATGRGGLAIGGTSTGMAAANPELEAYYNAKRMQDLQLAAQATQGGQQYATFGAGLLGTGSDLQRSMYGTQQTAYAPYQTALGGATTLEQLGQQPMDIGTAIGAKTSTGTAQAGMLQAQGITGAAQTMQPANAYSPWGSLLTGAGQALSQYAQPQQQSYKFDPFTGRAL